ncbi:hypothetical protein CFRA_03980 [Corynebacterium frankenforstense DSM 45800]|uniref:Secreted protein n=1 Tax=Corynebacterium frankenforstense DSM 45800 TaxID=1437875 RepID=A0A1L7CRW3_9CORY|nr:hypothetical protein [Corynebacterium frankenforstense]APT88572.1 hypothetical protein CFRA_03980 [Corynebacterium frankenforstense DSM 45800]
MNRSLRRFGALSAAALAAGLALSACSPPNQQDSEKKIDTATEAPAGQATATSSTKSTATATTAAAAAELPGYADCQAAPVAEPATLTLDCMRLDDRVTGVRWDEWTAEGATGTGTRGAEEVDVELSEPAANEAGDTVFTTVTVDGETVTP